MKKIECNSNVILLSEAEAKSITGGGPFLFCLLMGVLMGFFVANTALD